MKKIKTLLFVILCVASIEVSYTQTRIDPSEIASTVPELTDFHEIIFPMWHEAFPARDIKALKSFVPQIKTSMEKINNASLPGILRDKENAWKNQLKEFNAAAENYYKAAEGNADSAMLNAAEKLHFNYEMMMRVLRPKLKEIDDYHQSLYVIYHKLYPDKKYDEISLGMDNLIAKADVIAKYPADKLKKRLGNNTPKFETASKDLYNATVALKEVLKGKDAGKKDEAVQNVHLMYQKLEALFE